jgi:glycosyltransferase involved in cell wall biosynthesis
MMPNVYPGEAARKAGKPFLLTPRGMLGADALKFSSSSKKAFWLAHQKRAIGFASCLHGTAESELEDIRTFGLRHPVAVIPNGIDLPDFIDEAKLASSEPFILSLGRIHPKKGLDRLVSGFAAIAADFPGWRLKIVGPDELGFSQQLITQVRSLQLTDRVSIEGPVFGADKFELMRKADLFVLPTLHENFAMTVAESLAVGTPVISTKGAPWEGLETHGCGWWIDHGAAPMTSALQRALSTPHLERLAMGQRGRAWMRTDFSWEGVAEKMCALYEWLSGRGQRPDFVWV